MSNSGTSNSRRGAGFSIHLLTATGALAGIIALQAVIDGHIRTALLWLIVCQVLDGIDGPIARKFNVGIHAPHIDGHVLDLVIDYVTCVVVPTVLLIRLNVIAPSLTMAISGLILVSSALWFARTDQETSDAWFNGFPAIWNIVIPSFLILETSQSVAAVICVFLCLTQLTNIKFPHLVRVEALRIPTYAFTLVYFTAFTLLSAQYPHGPTWAKNIIIFTPIYLLFAVVWRTWFSEKRIFGISILKK